MDHNQKIVEETKALLQKAEINREILSRRNRRYKNWDNFITFCVIFLSAIIATFSLADPNLITSLLGTRFSEIIKGLIALSGLFILIISVLDKILGINEKKMSCEIGVKTLTEFIRECHLFKETVKLGLSEEDILAKLNYHTECYSTMQKSLPLLDDGIEFLKAKKVYRIKKQASKKIDSDPLADISAEIKQLEKLEKRF